MSGLERLRGLREERLRRTVALCAKAHPFYRGRFEEEGIDPEGIRTLADLEKLPLTQKSDFMDDPASFSLDPALAGDLSFEERTLWNIAYTTGTTSGRPSPFFNTTHDQYHIMMQARACNEAEGLRPGDSIANLYPLSPMPLGGYLCCVRSAEIMGLPSVSALTGRPLNWNNPEDYQYDHVIPIARGGDNTLGNLQMLCTEANQAKGRLTDEEFIDLCKEVVLHNGYKMYKPTDDQ